MLPMLKRHMSFAHARSIVFFYETYFIFEEKYAYFNVLYFRLERIRNNYGTQCTA